VNNFIKEIKINKIIHEPARLLIMTIIASRINKKISFNELKEISQLSSGNLSIQLKNLEEASYVIITKSIKNKKTYTEIEITKIGENALEEYLNEIEKIIKLYKKEI